MTSQCEKLFKQFVFVCNCLSMPSGLVSRTGQFRLNLKGLCAADCPAQGTAVPAIGQLGCLASLTDFDRAECEAQFARVAQGSHGPANFNGYLHFPFAGNAIRKAER